MSTTRGDVAHFLGTLRNHPRVAPSVIAVDGILSYDELVSRVDEMAGRLVSEKVRVLATLLDNGPSWIVADLAALAAGVVHVPLPAFFTDEQRRHVLSVAGVDTIIGSSWHRFPAYARSLPPGTAKVTFTSGTTGTPKGVCLSAETMLGVADGIAQATSSLAIERHLCALPLAILLENIAGVLAPLLRGVTIVAPPLASVGIQGSSTFDPASLDATVRRHDCNSVVLLPQMLRAWTAWLQATKTLGPPSLRLVAVGGAQVGAATLATARKVGLPAYEGYGLSEGGSVQTLNLPDADRLGSAGRPLANARLRVASDGEIEIAGMLFLGYLDSGPVASHAAQEAESGTRWWPTGDLGRVDADGFVHLTGRKKDVLVTGFGRNVSPEWVEAELQSALPTTHAPAPIARAVVLGEGRAALAAVVWPTTPSTSDADLDAAVAAVNGVLPDYARIRHWVRARHPFDLASGLATANGRPRRQAIAAVYLDELYLPKEAPSCPSSIA